MARGRGDTLLWERVLAVMGVLVVWVEMACFAFPPAAAHASPFRSEGGGGNGVLCFSLVSRVRGNDVAGVLR